MLQDYQQRMVDEYTDLSEKMFKLDIVLKSDGIIDKVGDTMFNLLKEKYAAMAMYRKCVANIIRQEDEDVADEIKHIVVTMGYEFV